MYVKYIQCNSIGWNHFVGTGGSLYDFPYEGQVYLDKTGTISPSDGQVEMYLEGQWQKICYTDKFNDAVATTVCRQYGYTGFTDKEPVNV